MLRFIALFILLSVFLALISIHPMLRFIIIYNQCIWIFFFISIHPMLRFIVTNKVTERWQNNFNTSHVTVYPQFAIAGVKILGFQYIPCYGLSIYSRNRKRPKEISIHPMLRFIYSFFWYMSAQAPFQYIPCYGLSLRRRSRSSSVKKFQYIPCYGLSDIIFSS